jgi:hypothetical protein
MDSRFTTALIFLFAMGMASCLYTSDGVYTVEPESGEQAVVTVQTSLDTMGNPSFSDSLDLEISYSFRVEKGEPYLVDCQLEDLPVHEIGFYYSEENIYLTHLDSLFTVESDTTVLVEEGDTVFAFISDLENEVYVISATFHLQSYLPVDQGENILYMGFYYSANTNSLADYMRIEAKITELEYSIWFEEGGTP